VSNTPRWLIALIMVLQGAVLAGTVVVPTDLVTHNQIVINAAPGKVWPLVMEPSSWKMGPRMINVRGIPGQLGEQLKGVMDDGHIAFLAENVEVIANQRRTIRLSTEDGKFLGFAVWTLTVQGSGTLVQYEVYSQVPLANLGDTPAQIAAAQKNYHDMNYQRFAVELTALKKRVEGP